MPASAVEESVVISYGIFNANIQHSFYHANNFNRKIMDNKEFESLLLSMSGQLQDFVHHQLQRNIREITSEYRIKYLLVLAKFKR